MIFTCIQNKHFQPYKGIECRYQVYSVNNSRKKALHHTYDNYYANRYSLLYILTRGVNIILTPLTAGAAYIQDFIFISTLSTTF